MVVVARAMAVAAVVLTGFIFASCSSSSLNSVHQQYVTQLRGSTAGIPSQISDQALVKAGKTACTDIGSGLTKAEAESGFGLKLNDASITAVIEAAIEHLCPRYKDQLSKF
jgi:hypothetical protein